MNNATELVRLIEKHRLKRWTNLITSLARDGIDLASELVGEDDLLPTGCSKFGGEPDLPRDLQWPTFDGWPLTFLAQVDLCQVAACDTTGLLPACGWLYFFLHERFIHLAPFGEAQEMSRVLFFDGPATQLVRRQVPPPPPAVKRGRIIPTPSQPVHVLSPCRLTPQQLLTLPDLELFGRLAGELVEAEEYGYLRLLDEFPYSHKMLGYPDPLRSDEMPLTCELAGHKFAPPKRRRWLLEHADTWLLLLQLEVDGSDDDALWGNCGTITFWIRRSDLRNSNFDDCWMVHQCYGKE